MAHEQTICVGCEEIISQCRCPACDKVTKYDVCDACIAKGVKLYAVSTHGLFVNRMLPTHAKEVCVGCRTVVKQCKCMDCHKVEIEVICDACKAKGVNWSDKSTHGLYVNKEVAPEDETYPKDSKLCQNGNLAVYKRADNSYSYLIEDVGRGKVVTRIDFQHGPVKEVGINGCQTTDLLVIVLDQLEGFQNGPYACHENNLAIYAVRSALQFLELRRQDRVNRGVEGFQKP